MERKKAAGMPAAVSTTATDMHPQPPKTATTEPIIRGRLIKKNGHGAGRTRGRFDYLYALREEHQQIRQVIGMAVPSTT
jgi:hypothetical protein